MADAWDLVPESDRSVDKTINFILFTEDEVCEPSYFRSFQVPGRLKVNVIDNQSTSFKNIINTIQYCKNNELLEETEGHFYVKVDSNKQIWSVFDRDIDLTNAEKREKEDLHFTLSIQTALQSGLKVAWSNDVFELWVLLHFEDVPVGTFRHRDLVYDRLTEIWRYLPDQTEEMAAITSKPSFNYKTFLKRKDRFNLYVLPYLLPKYEDAIRRAKELESSFPAHTPFHDCNPCTKVHHLVISMLEYHNI